MKHKIFVFINLSKIILKLFKRALCHDNSKFRFSEAKKMIHSMKQFRCAAYGTAEYAKLLEENKEVIQLHYARNDHHPEHFKDYKEMSLIALIEMISDWQAAVKKQKNGDLNKSFEIAREKYGISDEMFNFLKTLK
jgi:chromatin segregation and condensation protein Rec8/ScpA/Scc1 (kleisin family)